MKILSVFFLSFFLGNGCDTAKAQDMKDAIIEYTATTRGFYQKITVKNKTVTVAKDRNGNNKPITMTLSAANWKEIISTLDTVALDKMATLKAPTEKRFYDGAAIATLQVTYKHKTHTSAAFDHGFPPKELQQCVAKLQSFVIEE